jgi:hypothetical protein
MPNHPERRGFVNRVAAILFGVAGILTLLGTAVCTFYEPTYYDASTFGDYLSVVLLSAALVMTGVALVVLWRDPPVQRGSVFLLLGGVGAAAMGMGNLLEDAFDVEAGVWGFFGGGIAMLVSLIIAGISALTVDAPGRWSGLFLLFAAPGATLGFGLVMMGVSWILFGLWLAYEHRAFVVAIVLAVIPAAATILYLYADDLEVPG